MNSADPSINHLLLNPTSRIDFPVKLNVHYCLPQAVFDAVIRLNQRIMEVAPSDISFAPKSFMLPHLTIYMGFCEDNHAIESTLEYFCRFVADLHPQKVSIGQPYLKHDRRNWVFTDIEPISRLIETKRLFSTGTEDFMTSLNWDVVNEPPHVTLAYIRENHDLVEDLLKNWDGPDTAIFDTVGISFAGARGSCLGHIKTVALK